jgi:hypothetical protein
MLPVACCRVGSAPNKQNRTARIVTNQVENVRHFQWGLVFWRDDTTQAIPNGRIGEERSFAAPYLTLMNIGASVASIDAHGMGVANTASA